MVEERVDCWLKRLRDLKENGEVHKVLAVTSAFSNGMSHLFVASSCERSIGA